MMTVEQAFKLIDHNLARLAGTRQDHDALQYALRVAAGAAGIQVQPAPVEAPEQPKVQ